MSHLTLDGDLPMLYAMFCVAPCASAPHASHDGLALAKGGERRTHLDLGHLDVGPRRKDDAIEAENAIKEVVMREAVQLLAQSLKRAGGGLPASAPHRGPMRCIEDVGCMEVPGW